MNKVVTICGSMRFKDKMMEVAKELEIKNKYIVIQCVYIKRMQCSGGGIIFILSVERLCRIVKKTALKIIGGIVCPV